MSSRDDVTGHLVGQPVPRGGESADESAHARSAPLVPGHIAIVMDGNGRWATRQGLTRTRGHTAGGKTLIDVVEGAVEIGIRHLTVFGFSTENWCRPAAEVDFLMTLMRSALRKHRLRLHANAVRIRHLGRRTGLPPALISEIEAAERLTAGNDRLTLTICLNYGGRAELLDAARGVAEAAAVGTLDPAALDAQTFARYLYAPDLPDVDLFIRTAGEQRISNFLLWQCAYAELAFVDTPWPDFDRHHLRQAVEVYATRNRTFGTLTDPGRSTERPAPRRQPCTSTIEP
ncbi:Trans,polycis-polyprenyl diphosphate synthase ((2Z,6E)-farnesyl diphosphate specific) [Streptomyces noursei ATCC 11455]|uniref:polyprenyl diphosphate synthase n=1 Tax=Streptomyces noursei TaxID=1971 RepID=UPI00081CD347|nr:Trans,polycis-polyprenyl diphosphate synthase ((2Z,6E)-farnesyl diphosphate specific) [Streptomyces noursei ATCC 11455]